MTENTEGRQLPLPLAYRVVSTGFLILQRGLLTATFQIPFPLRARQTGKVVQWQCSQDSMSSTGLKRVVGRADKKGDTGRAGKQCSRTKGLSRIVILILLAVLRTEGRKSCTNE